MSDWDIEGGGQAGAWRARPVILAAIGAVAAILVQQLLDRANDYSRPFPPPESWRIALSIAIGTGAMAFGFGVERLRLLWTIAFAVLAGTVAGLIFHWNGGSSDWGDLGDWRYASLFLSIAIAVPLFQTARDEGAWRFPYRDVHGHAWTNVVLWCACWAFVGIVFALAWLLAALFNLIGLDFVEKMLERHWFAAGLAGVAFGGALGLFRERDRIVRLLQRVVTGVLAVLAPVLGAGLLLFLAALPFTGLDALWEATKATTPILLSCAIGALILANAVIGNGEEEEATNPLLRWGAMALGLAILPLCVIAAIATGLRIDQYGFTPDRLWALIFVILATAYGLAYLVSLVLGRNGWAARVRPANLHLAFVVAVVALFLATPILSFNAISTRDQVARLESGKIKPDRFDWAALAFDFGDPGKAALKRLASSKNAPVQAKAKDALFKQTRYDFDPSIGMSNRAAPFTGPIDIHPAGSALPPGLREALFDKKNGAPFCYGAGPCRIFLQSDGKSAIAVIDGCAAPSIGKAEAVTPGVQCAIGVEPFVLRAGKWLRPEFAPNVVADPRPGAEELKALRAERDAIDNGNVTIRAVPYRQVYIGNRPVGSAFRDCSLEANDTRC